MKLPLPFEAVERPLEAEQRASFLWRIGVAGGSLVLRTVHAVTLVMLLIIGLGPISVAGQGGIHAYADTLRQPMALWPNGFDLSLLVSGFHNGPHRTLLHEHGLDRHWGLDLPDHGRDDRRLCALSASTQGLEPPVRTGAGHAVHPSVVVAGSALPDRPGHAACEHQAGWTRSGPCGCLLEPARSTS